MKRFLDNLFVDLLSAALMVGMAATGYILRFPLPPGTNKSLSLWGLTRHQWGAVHTWIGYGLAAAVWSRDIFKCLRVVKQLRAGIVWVNTMQPCYVEAPWGGYKQSGHGREMGLHGQEEFLETKQVHINLNEAPIGWY